MSKTQWPQLPENLVFDAFYDEDLILDFILMLDGTTKKILLEALDKSKEEDVTLYARTPTPSVHILLMKFVEMQDRGLILLLSRNESNIYSYFERLKEEHPTHVNDIDYKLSIIHEEIRVTNEMLNQTINKHET